MNRLSRCLVTTLLPQRHRHRSRLVSLPQEIQKHPAAVAPRQMLAVHARQFPAAQRAQLGRGCEELGGQLASGVAVLGETGSRHLRHLLETHCRV